MNHLQGLRMSKRGAGAAANLSRIKSTKRQPSEETKTPSLDIQEEEEEEEDDEVASRASLVAEQAMELASEENSIIQEETAQEASTSNNSMKKKQTTSSAVEDGFSPSSPIVSSDGWPQLGTWAAKWSTTNMDFINPFYQIIERGKKYWSTINSLKEVNNNETTAPPVGEAAGTNQKLIVHTTEVTLVTQWNSQTREKFQMQFQQAISNHTNLSRYDCMAPQPQADIDMFFRNEGIDNHKSLSDPEFLSEFKRIMCNHEVSHGAQAPLEKLLMIMFSFAIGIECVTKYQYKIIEALELTNSGSLRQLKSQLSVNALVKILIRNFYVKEKYKGPERFRAVTKELQENLQNKYADFKCPHLEHYVDDVFLMVRIVNRMLYYFELFNIPLWDNSKSKAVKCETATEDNDETVHKPKEGHKRHQSSSSSNNHSSNKKSKNDKSSKETEKTHPRCEGCGRHHGGTKAECRSRNHPDFNSSKALWEDSVIGKRYASHQKSQIDYKKKLNPHTNVFEDSDYTPAPWRKAEVSSLLLNNIKLNNSDIIYLRSEIIPGVQVNVLLDTGAQSNFISKAFFNILCNNNLILKRI